MVQIDTKQRCGSSLMQSTLTACITTRSIK